MSKGVLRQTEDGRTIVKHLGVAEVGDRDAGLLVEQISTSEGRVMRSFRLRPKEHAVFTVVEGQVLRIASVPFLRR